ncbi:MAG: hypothetical protein JXA44_04065 [Methanospirillaceae archaeon]|nr:hypothetical protein [Methanospirillaceae archaeon]
MTQASLLETFRPALEIGRSGAGKSMADNYMLGVIQHFASDKRLDCFFEDIRIAQGETGDTLADAAKMRMAAREMEDLISRLVSVQQSLLEKATDIISERHQSGIEQEGIFEIYLVTRKETRKADVELIQESYPTKWKELLKAKMEKLSKTYVPTHDELKYVFKKSWDTVLTMPGERVVGYDIRPIAPEVEI